MADCGRVPTRAYRSGPMQTAVVTGASRGLGLALARELAGLGWRLVIDAREPDALEAARAELAERTEVVAIAGDVADDAHRRELIAAAGSSSTCSSTTRASSGRARSRELADYPLDVLEQVYAVNVIAPLALIQLAVPVLPPEGRIVNVTSDAAVEPYTGWGGYGSSKAALEQLGNVLAAEHPELLVYTVDPGDMRTQLHQEAFPGEDISDRAEPEESVPGLLALIHGRPPERALPREGSRAGRGVTGRSRRLRLRGSRELRGARAARGARARPRRRAAHGRDALQRQARARALPRAAALPARRRPRRDQHLRADSRGRCRESSRRHGARAAALDADAGRPLACRATARRRALHRRGRR